MVGSIKGAIQNRYRRPIASMTGFAPSWPFVTAIDRSRQVNRDEQESAAAPAQIGLDCPGERSIAVGVACTERTQVPGEPSHPAGLLPMAGLRQWRREVPSPTARRALMANSKQIASSTKSARAARKGGAAGKKSIKRKPAPQGRRAATAPEEKRGDEAGACHHSAWARHRRIPR